MRILISRTGLAAVFVATASLAGADAALADSNLLEAQKDPNQWVMYGGGYENQRYSQLAQINTRTVKNLKVAYAMSLGTTRAQQSSPIVVDGTLYVTSSQGPRFVFAADAATGRVKWRYEPELPEDLLRFACCDAANRGVSFADGKVYVGRMDGHLVALDAATGKEQWKAQVVDYTQGSVINSPPLIVKGLVITGFAGGEYGIRGSLRAFDKATGKPVWTFESIPKTGEPGSETWKGDSLERGGGAMWHVGSYDARTDTVFWGVGNPGPWSSESRGPGTSNYGQYTNLYTASTVALDPNTGKLKWHIQHTPYDAWDYDGVNELVLADLKIDGKAIPTFLKADRNGFFYVVNRDTGKLISANPFVHVNWAERIDLETGKPIEVPAMRPAVDNKASAVCPNLLGGKNWQPMAFSPRTSLAYIPANDLCMDMKHTKVEFKRGQFYAGVEYATVPRDATQGEIVAYDPVARKIAWALPQKHAFNGGVLATAGDLVFYGDIEGNFNALDARSGAKLWSFHAGTGIIAAPTTFSVGGKQYVAVVVGRSVNVPVFLGDSESLNKTAEGGMLFVFGL